MKLIRRIVICTLTVLLPASMILSFTTLMFPKSTDAAKASEWRSGRIIDDVVFNHKGAMSVAEIQQFLNSKVGTGGYDSVPGQCDSNGTRSAQPFASSTRAEYAASLSRPQKFTCLKDYYEVPKLNPGPGVPANNYGGKAIPSGAKSAAQIIWDAAQRYHISPKVLLVTIHKESAGPLTTDDWPFEKQYTYAMGAHCPDTAPCDENYAGFSMQMHESARLFKYYLDNMNEPWWPYKKLGWNNVLYNPNASCGSSNVYIETKATAALYTYTPYQPNAAALANLYGTGDSCSAYGNRNFWRIYYDWFGPPYQLITLPNCNVDTSKLDCVWRLYNKTTHQQLLTISKYERDILVNFHGYKYEGVAFYSKKSNYPGVKPVFRLGGQMKHIYTISAVERDALKSSGFSYEGVAFYADPASATGAIPVYRLYYGPTNKHVWTGSIKERDSLRKLGFRYEGLPFLSGSTTVLAPTPPAGQLNTYRFLVNPSNNNHLWTTSETERDKMVRAGYKYEGVGWNSLTDTSKRKVYRLYTAIFQQHLYTTDKAEYDRLVANGTYKGEGVAFYVPNTSTAKPVYRLYSPQTKGHFWTTSSTEKAILVNKHGFKYEGIAWYEP